MNIPSKISQYSFVLPLTGQRLLYYCTVQCTVTLYSTVYNFRKSYITVYYFQEGKEAVRIIHCSVT
jgi:hypothetical protein